MRKRPYYHINSLEKASKILDLLAASGEMSVSEIGKRLGMHRSATHRFLATLKGLGYLEQSEDSSYRLSFKLFELGMSVANRIEVRKIVHPFLIDLRARHEETANFAILEGLDIFYIDKVESPHLLRMDLAVGCRIPAYCTALGRVILAYRQEGEVLKLLRGFKFTPRTLKTISNLPDFLKRLRKIREQGYEVNDEEFELGIRGLAAPIFNYTGECIGAIGLAGPTVRLNDEKMKEMQGDLLAVGKTISLRLGNPLSTFT